MHESNSAPPGSVKPGVTFANFRLDDDGTLLRGETPVHLPPKELAALRLLMANAGRIVTQAQLRQALWGDVHVTADSVPKCVSSLRSRLEPEDCIQTVYKRGYRFSAELKMTAAGPDSSLPRLAILPFAGTFGVPDYLGSVIAEETMARLSAERPSIISVLAQDSVFTLARRGLTALEVGRQLNADRVLAGSLRSLPMHYRLRAEMIRVSDGTQLWVEDVLVDRNRIAGLEAELINRLVFRLAGSVHADKPSTPAPTPNITPEAVPPTQPPARELVPDAVAEPQPDPESARREAHDIFQRAHHEWQSLERHRMQDGLQHLLRAVELDPSLIEARVDLINLCVTQGFYGFMSPPVAADIAFRTAESISGAEANTDATLPALGWIRFYQERNLPAAITAFSLSAHLPHDPWITRARTMFALSRHRFGEAIAMLRSALTLDPYSPWLHARLAWSLHLAGEANASLDQIRSTLNQFPEHPGTNLYGAVILAFNDEADRACEIAGALTQRLPYFDLATEVHAYALACAGKTDEAHAILERLQWLGRERFLLKAFTPAVYVALGDHDSALAELSSANEFRCPWFFQSLADPRLRPLASRPEFQRMQKILVDMEADAARDEQLS
jgi:DNA-binding winged helix-turn-helix (wHTH) protein/tetratricopeptide (TPR) repeat protein